MGVPGNEIPTLGAVSPDLENDAATNPAATTTHAILSVSLARFLGRRRHDGSPGYAFLPARGFQPVFRPPMVMRRMTSWPSIQRCLKAAATWPAATASMV